MDYYVDGWNMFEEINPTFLTVVFKVSRMTIGSKQYN